MDTLLTEFERDIKFNAHGFSSKVSRSQAARKIVAMGKRALPLIVKRLEDTKPDPDGDMSCAWAALMGEISLENNLGGTSDLLFGNISAWITWAKEVAA